MYKIYNDENTEMPYRNRDDVSFFEKDELYAIHEETGDRVDNANFNQADCDAFKEEIRVYNIINGGSIEAKEQYNQERCTPNHASYDYCYARCNADDGYVSIGDQQDMQYWDAVNGTTTWQDHITAVKERYPKPNA